MGIRCRDARRVAHRAKVRSAKSVHTAITPPIAPLSHLSIRGGPRRARVRRRSIECPVPPDRGCMLHLLSLRFRSSLLDAQQRTEPVYRSWSSRRLSAHGDPETRGALAILGRGRSGGGDGGSDGGGGGGGVGAKRVGGGCDPLLRARVVGGEGEVKGTTRREDREIHENGSRRADSPRSSVPLTISLGSRRGPIIPSSDWSALPAPARLPSRAISLARTAPLRSSPDSLRSSPLGQAPSPSLLPASSRSPPRTPARPAASVPFDIYYVGTWALERKYSSTGKRRILTVFLPLLSSEIFALVLRRRSFFRSGFCSRYNTREYGCVFAPEYLEYRYFGMLYYLRRNGILRKYIG